MNNSNTNDSELDSLKQEIEELKKKTDKLEKIIYGDPVETKIYQQEIQERFEQNPPVIPKNPIEDSFFFKLLANHKIKLIIIAIVIFLKLFYDHINKITNNSLGWLMAPINPNDVSIGRGGSVLGLIVVIIFLATTLYFVYWARKNRDKQI